jgi:hypothetical protein
MKAPGWAPTATGEAGKAGEWERVWVEVTMERLQEVVGRATSRTVWTGVRSR